MKKFFVSMFLVLVLSVPVFASTVDDDALAGEVDDLGARLADIEAKLSNKVTKDSRISISAWGSAIFAPWVKSYDGDDNVPLQTTNWGGNNARIGWTIKGESESGNIGFQVDSNADGGDFGHQDQQKVWAKPTENLTIELGPSVFYDALRGNSVYGSWNWLRFADLDDEDAIFARAKAGKGDASNIHQNSDQDEVYAGTIVHYDNDQFHAFASLDQSKGSSAVSEEYTTSKMLERGQYGLGYELDGIGMVRAQYIGKAYLDDPSDKELKNYGIFNAALKLDNLADDFTLDVGYFHPTEEFGVTGDSKHGYKGLNAYAKYTAIDSWTLHSTVQTKFDKKDKDDDEGLGMQLGVGADYNFNLTDGVMAGNYTVNTDLRYFNENWTANDNSVGALVGISKNLSNGRVGIGVEYTSTKFAGEYSPDAEDSKWTVPIIVEYWF